MKNLVLGIAVMSTILTACNNSASDKSAGQMDGKDSKMSMNDSSSGGVTEKSNASIKEILAGYLQLKNAFAKDDSKGAGEAGNKMVTAFADFNKSGLTAGQAKAYADVEDDAKEHAEHIGKNVGNIEHQREHFEMLSKDVYQLVKTFGGGQKLYYDHCSMYNDGKGADWISESKDISNPYMGKSMPGCGSVEEELN